MQILGLGNTMHVLGENPVKNVRHYPKSLFGRPKADKIEENAEIHLSSEKSGLLTFKMAKSAIY